MRNPLPTALLTSGTLLLASCSGGSSNSSPTPPTAPATDVDFDVVVTSGNFPNGPGVGTPLRFDGNDGSFLTAYGIGGLIGPASAIADPRDIVPDPNNPNELLVVNSDDFVLRYRAHDGVLIGRFEQNMGLNGGGCVFGPNGNAFVGARSRAAIAEFDAATGAFLGDFLAAGSVDFPRGFVFGTSGDLFLGAGADPATGTGGGGIVRIDGSTGAVLDNDFVFDNELNPLDVIAGPNDTLYVSSQFPFGDPNAVATVRVYSQTTGALLEVLDPGLDATGQPLLQAPRGMGFGPDGLLYVSSTGTDTVLRFDPTSGDFLDVFVSFPGLNGQALTFVPKFDLVVTSGDFNGGIGTAIRFDGTSGDLQGTFADVNVGVLDPRDIVRVPTSGTDILINSGNDQALKLDPDGDFVSMLFGEVGLNPGGGVFGPNGNYFVGSRSFVSVREYDGVTGAIVGDFVAPNTVDFPRGFAFAADGQFYLGNGADPATGGGGGTIGQFDGTTGTAIDLSFIDDPKLSPLDVIAGPNDTIVTSSEFPFGDPNAVSTVRIYSTIDGSLQAVYDPGIDPVTGQPFLQAPRGMGFGPDGLLYVSSTGNGTVLRFDPANGGALVDVFSELAGLNGQALNFVPRTLP